MFNVARMDEEIVLKQMVNDGLMPSNYTAP